MRAGGEWGDALLAYNSYYFVKVTKILVFIYLLAVKYQKLNLIHFLELGNRYLRTIVGKANILAVAVVNKTIKTGSDIL